MFPTPPYRLAPIAGKRALSWASASQKARLVMKLSLLHAYVKKCQKHVIC
jgi:hypothetical protein